ncbi:MULTISPECIES: IS630 family transposase [Paraburkholderia]|uniref:IS630 family transposase n=1 Tax=Paraburkholderia TaxID=1822464 RepID=UPI002255E867|nr:MULTISPECIES: IS630 family transposase [Paraburkholderia]MCX4176900.1 IS630 family transposase [Paraburkholderia madseniana]MDQ6464891.1 IS630 family transposase [Paraburkholderia madseniana]
MNLRYRVELDQSEREALAAMLSGGKHAARKLKRAQILLAAHAGKDDASIAATVAVGESTVYRTKRRFVEMGLEAALNEQARPGAQRKLSGKEEALLIATACTNPPPGRARWTLELLADTFVKLTEHEALSRETVRRRLAENDLKPWRKDMWCIPKIDAEYVARMEDVLDLYAETPDPQHPVVCFDESPTQLIGEVRQPIPAEPGKPLRYDCEYKRNGTANLFVFLDAHRSWRKVKVTERRTADDFAQCMRDLVDIHYPHASRIRVVLDNLSTHTPAALYQALPPAEARRILQRIEFHYTPKHASWLNMVEIEIGVLRSQCLDRRIDCRDRLISEVAAWEQLRNARGARINWMFSTERAQEKLAKAYPVPTSDKPS